MPRIRLPRFTRSEIPPPLQLTMRDREIVRAVSTHRFLRSHQIYALVIGSPQQLLRRLQLLFHHGYLDRPRAQLAYFQQGGSRRMVYGLGNRGAKLLVKDLPTARPRFDWTQRNQSVRQLYLEHSLLISEVMVALEKSCARSANFRLVREDELAASLNLPDPFHWKVTVRTQRFGLRPDQVFGLEHRQTGERWFFFLEADRATMPIRRKNLRQSSFHRKLLAYEATWRQELHRSRFGFHRYRVLTVTTSAERLRHLIEDCRQLEHGHGLFLFTDLASLSIQTDILELTWQTTRSDQTETLT